LQKGIYIGEYTGVVRENRRVYFAPLNNYCYEYPVPDGIGKNYVIDATKGNFTRFINHSYEPNLKPVYAFLDGFYHLIFLSLRVIQKGEQLCYDYGRHYWVIRPVPEELN
jgi:SET domain-containing protein